MPAAEYAAELLLTRWATIRPVLVFGSLYRAVIAVVPMGSALAWARHG